MILALSPPRDLPSNNKSYGVANGGTHTSRTPATKDELKSTPATGTKLWVLLLVESHRHESKCADYSTRVPACWSVVLLCCVLHGTVRMGINSQISKKIPFLGKITTHTAVVFMLYKNEVLF